VSQLDQRKLRTPAVVGIVAGLVVILAAATAYLYGPLVSAKFGLIDDHEILSYFGTKKSVGILDLPRILTTQTEVGAWGNTERFRPVYYVFRILETVWHGLSPAAWYLTRMVIVALVAAGLGFAAFRALNSGPTSRARQVCSLIIAVVIGLLTVTIPAWSDIVMRLGPSEIYVALGVMLFCVGVGEVWSHRERHSGWIVAVVGTLIIVGSKEDGLIILPMLAVVYVLRFPSGRARVTAIILGVIEVAFSAYVALGFLPAVFRSHTDVYGNGHSVGRFVREFWGNDFLAVVVVALVIAFLGDIALGVKPGSTDRSTGARLLDFLSRKPRAIICALCLYVVLAELFFYQSYFNDNSFAFGRYGLLTELATAIAFATAAATAVEFLLRRRTSAIAVVAIIGMVGLVALPPTIEQATTSVGQFRSMSASTAAQLDEQAKQIDRGVSDVRRHPSTQIVILVQSASDYEPIVGLTSFLRLDDHITSIFLRPTLPARPPASEAELVQQLNDFAAHGGWNQNGWRVLPKSDYVPSKRTTCFYFGPRPTATSMCSVSFQID
jgi:hypothetical protein